MMSSESYKNSLCNIDNTTETTKNCVKTINVWNGYVGLPRYGEMYSIVNNNGNNWLINPVSSTTIMCVSTNGLNLNSQPKYSNSIYARPSIFLKSKVVITGGTGTLNDPFTIALK